MIDRTPNTDDASLTCPSCGNAIPLNATIAAPFIEAARAEFEAREAKRQTEFDVLEASIKKQRAEIKAEKASMEDALAARMVDERKKVAAVEAKKAEERLLVDIQSARDELAEHKLRVTKSQESELALRKKLRRAEERERELELQKQRELDAERVKIRQAATKDLEDAHRLQLAEQRKLNEQLQEKLADAVRKAEQGSQQMQGEVQELDLESMLGAAFPVDTIVPVPKGQHGGDCLQRVLTPLGGQAGSILWESKRTKTWSEGWLAKLRADQRAAGADLAIIVSSALPKGVERFELRDGVWISDLRSAVPLAMSLRQTVLGVHNAQEINTGKQSKMELLYKYLCSHEFRHRIEAVIESYDTMRKDLDAERRAMTKHWARREKQLTVVLDSTAKMVGELQGIAGNALPDFDGLSLPEDTEDA